MARMPILCVDFDGVIHSYTSGWKGVTEIPDPPVPGAIAFLTEALKHFHVCIYSSRSNLEGIDAMQAWLAKHSHPDLVDAISWPTTKPSAFVTLDDRAIRFTGEWPNLEELKMFKPWNK